VITPAEVLSKIKNAAPHQRVTMSLHDLSEQEALDILRSLPRSLATSSGSAGSSEYIRIELESTVVTLFLKRAAYRAQPVAPLADAIIAAGACR